VPRWNSNDTPTSTIDATNMTVLTALMSGVTPRRTKPKT
jgi:hypothetical protein